VAAIWGSAFVAQRATAHLLGPFLYNGARFLLGALVLVPVVGGRLRGLSRRELTGGAVLGILLAAASVLQQAGLQFTTAGKAGFITGLYVILVPVFLALGWRQRLRWTAWLASVVAMVGLFLLSTGGRALRLTYGDTLVLIGSVMWALHLILIGRLVGLIDPLRLALVQYVTCGVVSAVLGAVFDPDTLAGLAAAWWALLYTGIVSVGVGYTLQIVAQRWAPPTDAALILSSEAVFAAFWGWLLLKEPLTGPEMVGCALMLAGMVLAQIPSGPPGRRGAA
jgi:drug/metabolite transporter (DMT)-like permease